MPWKPPTFVELKMDAEISSYQDEPDPLKPPEEPFVERAEAATGSE